MSATAEAVTALIVDATLAVQGAREFEQAGQRIISANGAVIAATARTVDAQANLERQLARLTRQIDPTAAAQAKLEAGQRLLDRAFQRGAITADEQAQRLAQLDAKFNGAAQAAQRLAAANDRAAASQDAYNRALGVSARTPDDTAKRAADVAAFGAELDRLRSKYDPLFAAQQRYRATLAEITQAERAGALATAQATAARAAEKERFAAQVLSIRGVAGANDSAVVSLDRLAAANDNTASSSGRMRAALGQAGFQIQDFATQASMGGNALLAFGVQGSQLAGAFGPTGALAGAGLMIGVIAAQLLLGASAADQFNDALTAQNDLWKAATGRAEEYRAGLEAQRQTLQDLRVSYAQLTQAALASEERRLQAARATLEVQREQLATDAQRGIGTLPRAAANIAGMIQARERVGRPLPQLPRQVIDAVGALLQFRAGDANAEALAQLSQRLTEAASVASSELAPALLEVRDRVDGLVARATQLDGAFLQNERQMQALRDAAASTAPALETAGTTAGRVAGSMAELAARADGARAAMVRLGGYQLSGMEGAQQALERANAEVRALERGGLAGGEAFTREEQALQRIARAREDDIKGIVERQRVSREQAEALADDSVAAEARSQVIRQTLEREAQAEALRKRLQDEARDAARGNAAAVRDTAEAYDELRRVAGTGSLLVGSDADVKAVEVITARLTRARDEAERITQREADERTREANRFTQNWGDRLALETTRGLFEGSKNGETFFQRMGNSLKNILIAAFSSALSRNIFQPLISSVLGGGGSGGGFSLSSLFGGGTAQAATTGGGGATDSLGSFGTLRQAYNGLTSPGGLGSFFPGGSAVNSGFGGLDGLLNTSLVSPTFGPVGAFPDAAGFQSLVNGTSNIGSFPSAAGFQSIVDGTSLVGASSSSGLSIAGSLGPLAAIGGGAYGIYSGIQKGGVGGALGAAGGAVSTVTGLGMLGAAAGLLPALGALGPIGLGIGAVLAIAGALMPGAKPSGMGQLARTNLDTGLETTEGLGGKRFSQANATAAGSTVDNIVTLAKEIGAKLGGASIGGDVAAGVTNGDIYLDINGQKTRAANTEQGAKDIAAAAATMVLNEFRGQGTVQGDYRGIVAASGSLEALDQNLQWYEQVYKAFADTGDAADKTAQAVKAVEDRFGPLITKANELGLSTDNLTKARTKEIDAATKAVAAAEAARVAELAGIRASLQLRAASTDTEARRVASQVTMAQTWAEELRTLEQRLVELGETTESVASTVQQLRDAQGAEYWANVASSMEALDRGVLGRILRAEGRTGAADRLDFEAAATDQIEALALALADLGISADQAAGKIGETQQAIEAERQARARAANDQIVALDQSVISRILRATGRGAEADARDFEAAAALEVRNLARTLDDLGFSAEVTASKIAETQQAIDAERTARENRVAEDRVSAARSTLLDAYNRESAALEQTRSRFDAFARSLSSFRSSLKQGDLSPLSPELKLQDARARFDEIAARAQLGDVSAIEQLQGSSEDLLRASRAYYASTARYYEDFVKVQRALENTESVAVRQARIADQQMNLMKGQLDALGLLNENFVSFTEALAAYLATGKEPSTTKPNTATNIGTASTAADYIAQIDKGTQGDFIARSQAYLTANPDVAAAWSKGTLPGGSAEEAALIHFRDFGQLEGRKFARGGYASPGLALVGEEGPELVDFRTPARVYTADQTRSAMMAGGADLAGEMKALRAELEKLREGQTQQTRVIAAVGEETTEQGAKTVQLLSAQVGATRLAGAA